MANTPRTNEPAIYGGTAPVGQVDLSSLATPLTVAIQELRQSIDLHRTAVEVLAARLGATVPTQRPVDEQLVSGFEQLKKTLAVSK